MHISNKYILKYKLLGYNNKIYSIYRVWLSSVKLTGSHTDTNRKIQILWNSNLNKSFST